MSASEMNVETLKKSLAANGLAQYGTKEQMLHRLLTGGTEKKKPGPKPKGDVPKEKKSTSGLATAVSRPAAGGEEAAFMASERPCLIAQGITDPAALDAELKRRWTSVKKSKKSASPAPVAGSGLGMVKLPAPLDDAQMAAMGLGLSDAEWAVLPTLIACRIAVSLSIGAYSSARDPTNEYLKLTLLPGLKALQKLRETPADELMAALKAGVA